MGGLQEQLTAMEPVLIKTQAEVEVMIVTIMSDKEEAGKTQREASRLRECLMNQFISSTLLTHDRISVHFYLL